MENFQTSIIKACEERKDKWSVDVMGRIEYARDLHAADAIYHQACSVNFRIGKDIPQEYTKEVKIAKKGRPQLEERNDAFMKVVEYIMTNDDEITTLSDLVSIMECHLKEINSDLDAYTPRYMKGRLIEHFGTRISISNAFGTLNVVVLRETAENILHDFYKETKRSDVEEEKDRIIKAAVKLIKNDIKLMPSNTDVFPNSDYLNTTSATEYLPKSVKLMLQLLVSGKDVTLKICSLGQALVQAARPRSIIAPLQLGLGIQMHHQFGSKFLNNTLHVLGFSCPYPEVKTFEKNAAKQLGTDLPAYKDGKFVQYIADNTDHNISTLDGNGTFHGMGIMACMTPSEILSRVVRRGSVSLEELQEVGKVDIHYYQSKAGGIPLTYQDLTHSENAEDTTSLLDVLLKVSLPIRFPQPGWSGIMHMVQKGDHPGPSSVTFLPMIDLNPSDMTCIYSTMQFVCKQAKDYKFTPVLTFDQPLWWKSMTILHNEPADSDLRKLVLRLGTFHMEMSFLGSIGHLMAGSGLQELLELIYADQAVSHMLSGKAVQRAVRGHFLVDTALNAILSSKAFSVALP